MRQAGYASMDRMPPVPENRVLPADPPRVNDYDVLAEAYTASNETDAFTAAGFRISVISEPHPVPEARELFPDELAEKPSFLCFLFFVLHAG